ncbi:FAD-binding oxidoreductase [Polaribacter porphyrae]|uniref:FAD-binding oxidoreductase n=1 Tax=Polaribacter porphyrae TaxID=1137780 RepID=A0A2S7WTJ3_9FLAO|nr:FAD-binding oxidoreductase [Polaribacter porphyrae]
MAISSAIFILIAAITGIILAFEPISNQIKPYNYIDLETVSIAETITVLQNEYDEIVSLSIDENSFVKASVITKDGKSASFYINPKTGEKIGELIPKKTIFEFATNLHRSLFLKSTGRFLVGFFSFFLFLIAITGVILIAKRQGGFSKVFTKIIKEEVNQYYHIVFGRWFLIPIIIITLTGVCLSLEKFSLLPKDYSKHKTLNTKTTTQKLKTTDFEIFKNIKLNQVEKIEFPFSTDEEDFFFVKLVNKEIAVHQFTGQIISEKKQTLVNLLSNYSLFLHTGRGSIFWSLVLLLSCFAILFFIISGFSMTLKRRKKTDTLNNIIMKDEAEFIILIGSETGSTFKYANAIYKALIEQKKKVFIDELDNYTSYKKATNLLIFTATYGDGDAPANANLFLKKLKEHQPINNINFSVVGFGSTNYPEFCKFAILVQANLQIHENFTPILPLFKVNNQSFVDFEKWFTQLKNLYKFDIYIDESQIFNSKEKTIIKVIEKSDLNIDDTFLLKLKLKKNIKFNSGDLISITPKNEKTPRLYSIAKVDKHILLSIKKHKFGVCSTFLQQLSKENNFEATIQENKNFHFPKKAKEVILIANGTGIGPFLGMIAKNKKTKISLFWGGRTKESLKIYKPHIDKALKKGSLNSFETAFSRESDSKIYVQNVLKKYNHFISEFLKNGNTILICGSLAMQKDVELVLQEISEELLETSLEEFKQKNQIKTDCY